MVLFLCISFKQDISYTIPCSLLLKLGISGVQHQWFKSYLFGRSQSVSVDGHV